MFVRLCAYMFMCVCGGGGEGEEEGKGAKNIRSDARELL